MVTFGERLRQRRKDLKITQAKLAEMLCVSRSAVSNWEVGRNYPDLDILVSLSEILQASVDQLLKEEPTMVVKMGKEQRLNRKRKIALRVIIPTFIAMIGLSSYLVYHNTEATNQSFSPSETTVLTISKELSARWKTVKWNGVSNISSPFLKTSHLLTNDDGSSGAIKIRLETLGGKTVQPPFILKTGTSHRFNLGNRNQRFRLQVKAAAGQYILNLR